MDVAGTRFTWLEFDKDGNLRDLGAVAALNELVQPEVGDVVMMSHGWKTDKAGAMELYGALWPNVLSALKAKGTGTAGFVLAGVVWPSVAFRTNFDNPSAPEATALALPSAAGDDGDLSPQAFAIIVEDAAELAGPPGAELRYAAYNAQEAIGPEQARVLMNRLQKAFPARSQSSDSELETSRAALVDGNPQDVFLGLMAPPSMPVDPAVGSALSIGSALGQFLTGPRAAIARVLNQFTYYEMKARAGDVGAGLARVLSGLSPQRQIRLHLIGHSFGARLVTSAASTFNPPPRVELRSLTLLQGAFSHNAFSADAGLAQPGAFASVIGKVSGPISATHTHNDSACTIAYALASRLVRDNAKAIGDASDQFGAIGANGLLHLAQGKSIAQAMAPDAQYRFQPGLAHNFLADACVSEHGDVTNREVGRLVAAALTV